MSVTFRYAAPPIETDLAAELPLSAAAVIAIATTAVNELTYVGTAVLHDPDYGTYANNIDADALAAAALKLDAETAASLAPYISHLRANPLTVSVSTYDDLRAAGHKPCLRISNTRIGAPNPIRVYEPELGLLAHKTGVAIRRNAAVAAGVMLERCQTALQSTASETLHDLLELARYAVSQEGKNAPILLTGA